MDFDHLDREGYIRPEADLAKVQPQYQGVPDAAAGLLVGEFGPRLHSAYLYGSVVRGNAVPGRSDVDLLAVLPRRIACHSRLGGPRTTREHHGRRHPSGGCSGAGRCVGCMLC
jgi:hypothetical protein